MKKSKRSDYIVVSDKRLWVEHNQFPDGGAHSVVRLGEQTILALAKDIQQHVKRMRTEYKKGVRYGYYIHLTPEISFFINGDGR